jgi:hypothetical protein
MMNHQIWRIFTEKTIEIAGISAANMGMLVATLRRVKPHKVEF